MSQNDGLNESIDVSSPNENDTTTDVNNESNIDFSNEANINVNDPNSLNLITSTSLTSGNDIVYPNNVREIVQMNINPQNPQEMSQLSNNTLTQIGQQPFQPLTNTFTQMGQQSFQPLTNTFTQTSQQVFQPLTNTFIPSRQQSSAPLVNTFTQTSQMPFQPLTNTSIKLNQPMIQQTSGLYGQQMIRPINQTQIGLMQQGIGQTALSSRQQAFQPIQPLPSINPLVRPFQPVSPINISSPQVTNQMSSFNNQQGFRPFNPSVQQNINPILPINRQISPINIQQNINPSLQASNINIGQTVNQTYKPILPNVFAFNPVNIQPLSDVQESTTLDETENMDMLRLGINETMSPNIKLTRINYKKANELPSLKTLESLGVDIKKIIKNNNAKLERYERSESSSGYGKQNTGQQYNRQNEKYNERHSQYSKYDKYSDGRKKVNYKQLVTRPPIATTILNFPDLPIIEYAEDIYNTLKEYPVIAIDSPTGTGKTTYLPWYFSEKGHKVRVSIPTVVSVMASYKFVYDRSKKEVGYAAGREIRYDNNTSIVYGTTGHFVQKLLSLITKGNIGEAEKLFGDIFIIDEVHTATVDITVLIGLYKYIVGDKQNGPKLIFTSATYNEDLISPFYNDYPIIKLEETNKYNIDTIYISDNFNGLKDDPNGLIVKILKRELEEGKEGHIIVFRPGAYEVLTTVTYIQNEIKNINVYPIYSNMPTEEQNQIFTSTDKIKIIVGTNIIESSITIPDVRVVIDDMLEKISCTSKTGGYRLLLKNISKSASNQRKGRTGRTSPGVCYRLCSEDYFNKLDTYATIEIKRVPIHKYILKLIYSKLDAIEILKISEESYRESLDLLVKYKLIEYRNGKLDITKSGIFVSEMPLSIYTSILLDHIYKLFVENIGNAELQYLLVSGIAVCSMIDHYDGVGYFNIPNKIAGQGDYDYNKFLTDIDEEYHSKYKGRTDIHTLLNLYWGMENSMINARSYDDFNSKNPTDYIREYANINHLNNRKLKEVYKTMENTENTILKRFIREDIRLHTKKIEEGYILNIGDIICKLFNSVYSFNKIMQVDSTNEANKKSKPKYKLIEGDLYVSLNKYNYNNDNSLIFYVAEIIEITGINRTIYIASIISNDLEN